MSGASVDNKNAVRLLYSFDRLSIIRASTGS